MYISRPFLEEKIRRGGRILTLLTYLHRKRTLPEANTGLVSK